MPGPYGLNLGFAIDEGPGTSPVGSVAPDRAPPYTASIPEGGVNPSLGRSTRAIHPSNHRDVP